MRHKEPAERRPVTPAWANPRTRTGGESQLLWLQRSAGNRATTAYVQRQGPTVARVPGPTAIVHENQQLTPDFKQTNDLLDRLITERGYKATDSWAYRFINADPFGDIKYGGDLDLVGRCRQRLRTEMEIRHNAVKALTGPAGADFGDVRMAGGEFVTAANEGTLELLKNSEKQLKGEIAKYGLKVDGLVFKDYSMDGGPMQQGLKDTARRLAGQRKSVDALAKVFNDAKTAVEEQWRRGGPGIPPGSDLMVKVDAARASWIAAEDAYRKDCNTAQIDYPVLAAYSTTDNAAAQLDALANKSSADMAESLYKTIDERLKNIETVRSEVGDRFNPWKHPQIVALTKARLGVPAWKQKVIDEKAAAVRSGEGEEDKKVWATIAIGLGLLAAIPTGGSSLLAGVAAAGAIVGTAYSLNTLYEHYKDYQLASAETGMTLDKAQAISQDEPDLVWLAFDLLDLGLNVVGAMAAFKTLRGAMAAAEAGGVPAFRSLFAATGRAGLPPSSRNKIVAAVMQRMGGTRKVAELMQEVTEALAAANKGGKSPVLTAVEEAAKKLSGKQIAFYLPGNAGGSLNEIRRILRAAHVPEADVNAHAMALVRDFARKGYHGFYSGRGDFIILREGDDMASMLVHELAHRGQNIEGQLETLGTLRSEFQAFHMQREILVALPEEFIANSPNLWLRTADDAAILAHIRGNPVYAAAIAAEEAVTPGINAVIDVKADKELIVEWFLKGSAGK